MAGGECAEFGAEVQVPHIRGHKVATTLLGQLRIERSIQLSMSAGSSGHGSTGGGTGANVVRGTVVQVPHRRGHVCAIDNKVQFVTETAAHTTGSAGTPRVSQISSSTVVEGRVVGLEVLLHALHRRGQVNRTKADVQFASGIELHTAESAGTPSVSQTETGVGDWVKSFCVVVGSPVGDGVGICVVETQLPHSTKHTDRNRADVQLTSDTLV